MVIFLKPVVDSECSEERETPEANAAPGKSDIAPGLPVTGSGAPQIVYQSHSELCPLGQGGTRWYSCRHHSRNLIFPASLGKLDSIANSCPLCGSLGGPYLGCACPHSAAILDRSSRPGRPVRIRSATSFNPGQTMV